MNRRAMAAVAALVVSASASAYEPFSYTYLEASYFENTIKVDAGLPNKKIESDGWGVAGSYHHQDSGVFFRGHYLEGDVDRAFGMKLSGSGISADFKSYGIMVGGASQVNERASVHAGIGYTYEEAKGRVSGLGSIKADADIYSIAIGGRYWLIPMVELNGGLTFAHARLGNDGGNDNDVIAALGLRFQPVSMVSLGAGYSRALDSKAELVSIDVRFQF